MNEQNNAKNKKRLIPDIITPNRITYLRILLIPVFVVFFLLDTIPGNYYIAAAIFAVASLTDFADGYIARKYHLVSNMGKFLDPIADKVLVSTAFILLLAKPALFNYTFWGTSISVEDLKNVNVGYIIGLINISVIMARELIISGFRQVAATTGLVLAADKLGKYKTTFQDFSILFLLVALGLIGYGRVGYIITVIGFVTFCIATVLTVLSGVSYIVKNKAVLKDQQK